MGKVQLSINNHAPLRQGIKQLLNCVTKGLCFVLGTVGGCSGVARGMIVQDPEGSGCKR